MIIIRDILLEEEVPSAAQGGGRRRGRVEGHQHREREITGEEGGQNSRL